MSRTDLDSRTLAKSLRRMAGDGSVEWVTEPIQTSVLRDIADMLDEVDELRKGYARMKALALEYLNGIIEYRHMAVDAECKCDELRELVARVDRARRALCDAYPDAELLNCEQCPAWGACKGDLADRMRKLGIEVDR